MNLLADTEIIFMQEREKDDARSTSDNQFRQQGPQGVDKAPGEDPPIGNHPDVASTQKAKNNVDGDPELESDQPAREE
jgi:hypothetical protein